MSTIDTLPWHASHDNLVALSRHLHDEGILVDAEGVLDFIEKPWQWDTEWAEYQADENDPYMVFHARLPAYVEGHTSSADDLGDAIVTFLVDEIGTHASVEQRHDNETITIVCRRDAWPKVVAKFGLRPSNPLP